MPSVKWRPLCLGLDILISYITMNFMNCRYTTWSLGHCSVIVMLLFTLSQFLGLLLSEINWSNTVRGRCKAVKVLTNIHKGRPIARPIGRRMGRRLWIQHLIDILPLAFIQYLTIWDRVITAFYDINTPSLKKSDCRFAVDNFKRISYHFTVFKCVINSLWPSDVM